MLAFCKVIHLVEEQSMNKIFCQGRISNQDFIVSVLVNVIIKQKKHIYYTGKCIYWCSFWADHLIPLEYAHFYFSLYHSYHCGPPKIWRYRMYSNCLFSLKTNNVLGKHEEKWESAMLLKCEIRFEGDLELRKSLSCYNNKKC